jgi:hypothetical protein
VDAGGYEEGREAGALNNLLSYLYPDFGLRRCDGILFTVLPGVVVNCEYITASIVYEQYGISHRRNLGGGGGDFAAGGG